MGEVKSRSQILNLYYFYCFSISLVVCRIQIKLNNFRRHIVVYLLVLCQSHNLRHTPSTQILSLAQNCGEHYSFVSDRYHDTQISMYSMLINFVSKNPTNDRNDQLRFTKSKQFYFIETERKRERQRDRHIR